MLYSDCTIKHLVKEATTKIAAVAATGGLPLRLHASLSIQTRRIVKMAMSTYLGLGGIAVLTFALLGPQFRATRFAARYFTAVVTMVICATYGVFASLVFKVLGLKSLSQWTTARSFNYLLCPLLGIKFKVENEERMSTRPAIFISNHQTELDVLMLGRMFPKHTSVTSKKELKYVPFLGQFMTLSGAVFIDRANRKNAVASFDTAVKQIKAEEQNVWIFPEGTRSAFTEPDLLPFKKGCFHLAIQAGVPIVPVVVANYSHVFSFKRKHLEPGIIPVRVLEPIETKDLTAADVDKLVITVRENMLKEIKALGKGKARQ